MVAPLLHHAYELACSGYQCVKANDIGIPSSTKTLGQAVMNVTKLLLTVLGMLSVIFVVVGGLQYVISGGNSQRTKQARETILYAVIGLVVAASAYAIVAFLSGKLGI